MGTLDVNRDWQTVLSQLPGNYRELAKQHKQLETQYGNARITTAEELLRVILVHVGADLPLRQTAALLAEGNGPIVSPNCVHMKMRHAAPYLEALVAGMTSWTAECEPERWGSYDLIAVDGSSFAGRRATGTDARIHAALRLSDLSVFAAHATDVSGGESLRRFHWMPGQLVIADRGYSNGPGIVHVVDHEADVLVRLNRGAMPLFERDDTPLSVEAFLRTIPDDEVVDKAVRVRTWIGGHLRIVDGRLVATRLPADKAEEARARVRAELGPSASPETLEMAAYVALFTTAPKHRLSALRCIEAYRLRWQIELLFKRWKSLCHFDKLPNEREDTILSWLYAKILLGLIVDRIAATAPPLSPPVQLATRVQDRRAQATSDGQRPLEGHQHPVARSRRGAAATHAA
jgi:hypothetical protein